MTHGIVLADPATLGGIPPDRPNAAFFARRLAVASAYLAGEGIELGALNQPLDVSLRARVLYLDRFGTDELRRYYSADMDPQTIVPVDLVDDGELLSTIDDDRFDFVIANHFLEHCQDPIGALEAMLRVVRLGGVVYLAVPDKRFSFDADRPSTTLDHLRRDHEEGPAWSRHDHYLEWTRLVLKCDHEVMTPRVVGELEAVDSSIHFHVWSSQELLEFLAFAQRRMTFEIQTVVRNEPETIVVLSKAGDGRDAPRMRWNEVDGWHFPGEAVEWP